MWLLDAHSSDHAAGVPENIFRSIFYLCGQCGCYMMQRVSRDHHKDMVEFDSGETACINLRLAGDYNIRKKNFRIVAEEFPIFDLL